MAFCKNCGSQLNGDERFCGNCGTPLDGPIPNPQTPNTRAAIPVPNVSFDNFKVYVTEVFHVIISMISKPITTTINSSKILKKQSKLLLFATLAIIYGLLNIWSIKAVISKSTSVLNDVPLIGGYGQLISNSIPYGKIFFLVVVLYSISILAIFASYHLIGKYIFKSSCNPMNTLCVAICSSIPFIFCTLIQIIFSYISGVIGLIAIFFGVIISLICLYRGMTIELEISEDRVGYLVPISYLVMFLSDYIVLRVIIGSIISSAMKSSGSFF